MDVLYEHDSLEQKIIEEQAKKMEKAMDFEILADVLSSCGWTKYQVSKAIDNQHAKDIREWVRENCQEEVRSHGATWLFEDSKDATMFILRWS
jgi:hypothetical protein